MEVGSLPVGDWQAPGEESSDKVAIVGHEKMLFLLNGSNNYYDGYSQPIEDAFAEARDWSKYVETVHEFCEEINSRFLFAIVPNKATVLKDLYPLPLNGGITPRLDFILKNSSDMVFCPIDEFRNDPNYLSIFRRNDTHFGYYGSISFLSKLANRLGITGFNMLPQSDLKSLEHAGDLGRRYDPAIVERLFLPRSSPDIGKLYPISDPKSRHMGLAFSTYNVDAPIKKSIIIFGNSFCENINGFGMSPYIAQSFERFLFVWTNEVDIELVRRLRPDFVVLQTCERFLSKPPVSMGKAVEGVQVWPDQVSVAAAIYTQPSQNISVTNIQQKSPDGDTDNMSYEIKLDGSGAVVINKIPDNDMALWSGSIMLGILGPSAKSLPLHAMANNIDSIKEFGLTLASYDYSDKFFIDSRPFLEWYANSDNIIERMRGMVGPNKWVVYKIGIAGGSLLTSDFGIVLPLSMKGQSFKIFCNGIEMQSDQVTLDPHLALSHWFMPEGCVLGIRSQCSLKSVPDYLEFSIQFSDQSNEACKKFLPLFSYTNRALLEGLPETNRIRRVSGASANQNSFLNGGKTAAEHIKGLVADYLDHSQPRLKFLDWGVGCGRVARHLALEDNIDVSGIDIDEDNLNWCRDNLTGDYRTVGLSPPTPFPDNHFDVIYSCSVLSHLTEDVAHQWLSELSRILKPSGVALLSFNGSSNLVSYLGRRPMELKATLGGTMFDKDINHDLDGFIPSSDYYRASFAETEWWTDVFRSHFDVVAIEPAVVSGYQDIAVLRCRA